MSEENTVYPGQEVMSALEKQEEILHRARQKEIAVFLDYDGTLTNIVARPEEALLTASMRCTLKDLARALHRSGDQRSGSQGCAAPRDPRLPFLRRQSRV